MQRHLFHAAIPLAVDGLAEVPTLNAPTAADLLARSDLFDILPEPERPVLANATRVLRLAPGETLFAQGDDAEALFVLASGTVGILRLEPDGSEIVHRLSSGMTLGVIGLISATTPRPPRR